MNRVVKWSALGGLLCVLGASASVVWAKQDTYEGSSFAAVWDEVVSDPNTDLPRRRVSTASFFGFFKNKLLDASRRTLSDRSDVLPAFDKLLHPNGICLAGTWHITEETPYTGYFEGGSTGLIVARASAALSETTTRGPRALGIAGKIFPTEDPDDVVPTANFFTIEDLGGSYTRHFLDAEHENDLNGFSVRPGSIFLGPLAAAVTATFSAADSNPLVRQLYPIAEAGLGDDEVAYGPRFMRLVGSAQTPRIDAADFRDELDMRNYPNGIQLDIYVADGLDAYGDKAFEYIGYVDFTESVVSESCDKRLHFAHPKWRNDQ